MPSQRPGHSALRHHEALVALTKAHNINSTRSSILVSPDNKNCSFADARSNVREDNQLDSRSSKEIVIREFTNRVAVVTGAASGIGRGLSGRFASEGMKLVMADIESEALAKAAQEIRSGGTEVLDVVTDVSKADQLEDLAAKAYDTYGAVNILCNNAGVGAGGLLADLKIPDWQWVLGVNLWGVINGITAFLPRMLQSGEEGHIVNTASLAGLISAPFMAPYSATKFAVVAISESLFHEMNMTGSKVHVSVLCPGWVNTRIFESERNRPKDLGGGSAGPEGDARAGMLKGVLEAGLQPSQVADQVLDAIREDRLYVITHPDMLPAVEGRMNAILKGENPPLSMIG